MLRFTLVLLPAVLMSAGAAQANKVFVSNERGNSVTVLDSQSWEVIATFPAGNRPRGITISPDGKELYVCASDDDTVRVFDPETYKELHTLPSGPDPELFALDPSGNPLYVANEDDNLVTVVDVKTRQVLAEVPVGVEPEGVAVSPDAKTIINTSETTNMAHFIDASTYKIVHNVLVDQRPRYAEFTADGKKLYVSSEIGGTVSVIDMTAAEPTIAKKISFAVPGILPEWLQPVGVKATRDGSRIFVALGPANRVAVIDGATDEVLDYLIVGQRVWQMAFTPGEEFLITTNGNSNDVSIIDVGRCDPLGSGRRATLGGCGRPGLRRRNAAGPIWEDFHHAQIDFRGAGRAHSGKPSRCGAALHRIRLRRTACQMQPRRADRDHARLRQTAWQG
jgi:PQQ-dependent catabolism-associated beta-propeller protein